MLSEAMTWFHQAERRFVWRTSVIGEYVPVFMEVVRTLINKVCEEKYAQKWTTPDIGLILLEDEQGDIWGYALYISDKKVITWRQRSLFTIFKEEYQISVGAGPAAKFCESEDVMHVFMTPQRAAEMIKRKKLARNFVTLANKSENRRRQVSARLRYFVLQRDNSTCRACGRRPPHVAVHVDHITPVSWGMTWQASDDPTDYQVLCEACNLGKGNL